MEVGEIGYNELSPSFVDLPMEVIVKIFRHLNFRDMQSASLACRKCSEATQASKFRSKVLLKFECKHLSDNSFPGTLFLNTFRSFPNINLCQTTLGSVENLFNHIGPTVEHIVFELVHITEEQFISILKNITNLKTLSIIGSIFSTGQFLKSKAGQELLAGSLSNIREITIKNNMYLTDTILHHSTSITPNLERLYLSFGVSSYMPDREDHPRKSVFTFEFLLVVIKNHVSTLKEFHLSETELDDDCDLSSLANIKGLDLRKITFMNCNRFHFTGLETLLKSQKNLVELNLSNANRISRSCIELICGLTKLEVLKLCGYVRLSTYSILEVSKLKRLKVLDISRCDISGDAAKQGITKAKNYSLLELYMSGNYVSEDRLIQCAENFPNLQVFDMSNCKGVTNKVVQMIIKNLKWLRYLSLDGCDLITNAGLIGINVKSQLPIETASCASQDGFSIKELQQLETLNLQGCTWLSDESFKYGLKFLNLRILKLCRCLKISVSGIQAVVEHCPSIEKLHLPIRFFKQECYLMIVQHLQRLLSLHFNKCSVGSPHDTSDIIVINSEYLTKFRDSASFMELMFLLYGNYWELNRKNDR